MSAIALGGGNTLPNGGTIRQTQDAFQLETAIGKLIDNFGGGSSKSGGSASDNSANNASGAAAIGNPPGLPASTHPTPSIGGNPGKENK